MKAILIDTPNKKISVVEFSGNYQDIYKLIGCRTFETIDIDGTNDLYLDEEGTFKPDQTYFIYAPAVRPFAGRGLILAHDAAGHTIATTLDIQEVYSSVEFPATANLSAFDHWLDQFIKERQLNTGTVFTVEGPEWGTNIIAFKALIEAIKAAPAAHQAGIKMEIQKLDFVNGDIMGYFKHLAQALAQ